MSGAERRKHQRFSSQGAKVRCFSFDTMSVYHLKDFSVGGLCLQEGAHIPMGSTLSMEWIEHDLSKTRIQGKVVRSDYQLGIKFLSPKEQTKSWLDSGLNNSINSQN